LVRNAASLEEKGKSHCQANESLQSVCSVPNKPAAWRFNPVDQIVPLPTILEI